MSSPAEGQGSDRSDVVGTVDGVVFCGGESRRMGADKAMLPLPGGAGVTLLENALSVLDAVAETVVLATGSAPRYEALGRASVLDREVGAGPLAGLAAALDGTRATWLCALACDMPGVSAELFRRLLAHAEQSDLDVCLLETEAGVEPLCAVYRATCRKAVSRALDSGERKLVAFHADGLRVGSLRAAALTGSDACARNLNTREDYARVSKDVWPSSSAGESS